MACGLPDSPTFFHPSRLVLHASSPFLQVLISAHSQLINMLPTLLKKIRRYDSHKLTPLQLSTHSHMCSESFFCLLSMLCLCFSLRPDYPLVHEIPSTLPAQKHHIQKLVSVSVVSSTFSLYWVILANAQECCHFYWLQKDLLTP